MNAIQRNTLMLALTAALALPAAVRAEQAAPATPAPDSVAVTPEQTTHATMPGMGMGPGMGRGAGPGMGMGYGPMQGENCRMNKGNMMRDGMPCKMGPHAGCRMGGGDAMTDKRLDMLEKRMDMMQMMMQMMLQQQAGSGSQ